MEGPNRRTNCNVIGNTSVLGYQVSCVAKTSSSFADVRVMHLPCKIAALSLPWFSRRVNQRFPPQSSSTLGRLLSSACRYNDVLGRLLSITPRHNTLLYPHRTVTNPQVSIQLNVRSHGRYTCTLSGQPWRDKPGGNKKPPQTA